MDVRIGITQAPREIEVELTDTTNADELVAKIDEAVEKAGRDALAHRQARAAHRYPRSQAGLHRAGHGYRDPPRWLWGRRLTKAQTLRG